MRAPSLATRPVAPRARRTALTLAAVAAALSCTENLPTGPSTFGAVLRIVVPHDTIVVGDSSAAQAQALDGQGRVIQSLSFAWSSADSGVVSLAIPAADTAGHARTLIGRQPGRANVTVSLADPRFVTTAVSRTETIVLGGVRVLTTHDSTLTALNDTAVAVAAGLVRQNGALVPRAGQGVRWVQHGSHTAVVIQGDTLRYIARSNGPDTLVATADFCLAGAKCADTLVARVSQTLTLTLSTHLLRSWSFGDSLAPVVTFADRRGSGLPGTQIRVVPNTAVDSAIVRVGPAVGVSNPTTGVMAVPRLISIGNDTAHVTVQGIAADGSTVLASDTLSEIVRQVARRANVEPLHALMTAEDSIPVKAVARDARGAVIVDATVSVATATNVTFQAPWAGPNTNVNVSTTGTLTPAITGIALPDSNPLAPQVPVILNAATIDVLKADTVKAGHTLLVIPISLLDSTAAPAAGVPISFDATAGPLPAPVTTDANGQAIVFWAPPDTVAAFTLTGVRSVTGGLATLNDSAGRVVLRRSVQVIAADPAASKSTLETSLGASPTISANGTATVTVTVKDAFGNLVKTATSAAFLPAVTRGTVGAFSCTNGVCTATYTAPATAGADAISVKIGGVDIQFSPLTITVN